MGVEMTTVHAQLVGDGALLPRTQLDRLVELARQAEEVVVCVSEGAAATPDAHTEQVAALDWVAGGPDLYTAEDLKVRYR
jgi:hypothetical protein